MRSLNRYRIFATLLAAGLCLGSLRLAAQGDNHAALFRVQIAGHGGPMILITSGRKRR